MQGVTWGLWVGVIVKAGNYWLGGPQDMEGHMQEHQVLAWLEARVFLLALLSYVYLIVCLLCVCVCVCVCVYRGHKTSCRSQFSPNTWFPKIKLK